MKSSKPTKKDKDWQKKIEARVKKEDVQLGKKEGKEHFDKVLQTIFKKRK